MQAIKGSQAGQEVLKLEAVGTIAYPDFSAFEEYKAPSIDVDPSEPEA